MVVKKKQTITIITIALASFLIGTMFGVVTLATSTGRSPFDEIWKAINGLDERLSAVEEKLQTRELTVFSLWAGAEEANFKQALARFEEITGISVKHVGYSTNELLLTVETQLRAGASIADVVIAPWPSWILGLAAEGYIESLTDTVDTTKFPQNFLNPVTADNELWAAPFKLSGKPGFWYRKSTWTNNGWTVPTTYEEFKTLLATIKELGTTPIASGNGVGWPLSDTTEAWIIGREGHQLQLDLIFGNTQFTSVEVRNVFVELTSLLQAGYFSPPDEWASQITRLWDGTYAMYFQGSFITQFEPFASNLEDVGFFPFPETDGVTGAIDYAFVPVFTEHPDEAKQLIEFLASAEAQEIMVGLGGFLAPNLDVPDSAYRPIELGILQFMRTVSVVPDLDDAIGGDFQVTLWDQLKLLWVNPDMDIDTLLQTLQDSYSPPPF